MYVPHTACHLDEGPDHSSGIALKERGKEMSGITKMLWQWANFPVKKKLHIENWPARLKTLFPHAGFRLNKVSGKEATAELEKMHADLRARYEGVEDDGTGVTIVSWMQGAHFDSQIRARTLLIHHHP